MSIAATVSGANSESFQVGVRSAPEGAPFAIRAIRARKTGDFLAARRFAKRAMDADVYAITERTAGRTARRSNVVGNGWSYWYECFTGTPSGW